MRRYVAVILALVLTFSTGVSAYGADGEVKYDGNAKEFIFAPGSEYSPTDLFPEFKDVMPGDSLTQKITVRNDADKKVKVKVYMRALGAHEQSGEFLSQMHLRVKKSDNNEMAYMFDAAADETAQLSDWVYLGTLYSGGEINLDVILDVPVEMDSKFQNQIGYLDWEFRIEEFPVETGDPKPPQTGDAAPIAGYLALFAGAAGMIVILTRSKRKTKEA